MSPAEYAQLVEYLGRQFVAIDQRFTGLEESLAGFRHEMLGHMDGIYGRLERLDQEYHAGNQVIGRLDARLEALERHLRQ